MKKKLFIVLIAIIVPFAAWAATQSRGSGLLQSSAVVSSKPVAITSFEVLTDGSNAATVTVYDNATTGSGTVISKIVCTGAANFCGQTWDVPRYCSNGIYVSISGTGAGAIVEYLPNN